MGKAVAAFGTAVLVAGGIILTGGTATLALIGGTAAAAVVATQPSMPGGVREPTEFSYKTDAGWPIPFGRVACSGDVNYRVAYDATNRYQSLFCTLAASGPIKSIVSFTADDEPTSFDLTLNKATNGEHEGFMWLQTKLGTQPQTALTSPTGSGAGIPAPGWTSDHKASGKAVYCLTMFENSKFTEFPGGIVSPRFVIEGLYGWDPRQDSTWPGGSGSCDIEDPSTWVWIDNPAIAALNWAIGRWEGLSEGYSPARYGVPYASSLVAGLGASLDGIDVAAFVNAANVCDANGWTVAAYPTSRDDKHDVLTKLLAAAGAEPATKAGRISCVCHAELVASAVTVTGDDTAGPVEITLGQSRLERKNAIIPRFWSEDQNWEMTPIEEVSNPDWVAEDGGKRSRGLDLHFVGLADQAAQLGYYRLAIDREPFTGVAPFKAHMRRIAPGDCFTWSAPGLPLDGIKVKCLRRSYDAMSGIVRITFRSEDDAKHTDAYEQTGTTPPTVDPGDPPGPYVEPPSDLLVTALGWSVNVAYRNPNDTAFDYVNIFRAEDSTDFNDASIIDFYAGGSGEAINRTDDVTSAGSKSYWLAAFDVFGNVSAVVGPDSVSLLIAELDFLSGFLHLAADVGTVLSDLSGATFTRALAGYAAKADGSLQSFASGAPRVTDQGLLIENAATNLCIRSQEIDHGAWSKSAGGTGSAPTVTANATTAPDGSMTADRVVFNQGAGTTSADLSIVNSTAMTVANGSAYTASVWMRADTPCAVLIRHVGNSTYTLVNVTTTWQRFSVTETSTGTSRNLSIGLRGMGLGSSLSATVDVWQAQVELGSEATSEIATTTASVTRPVDALTLTLPPGDSADAIEIVHDGGTVNLTRADLANPLLLDLGGASGGAWVGGFIESVTVTPA